MNRLQQTMALLAATLAFGAAGAAAAAGSLAVEQAWIRAAPPGVPMLAGYADLRNDGDAPLRISAVESAAFDSVSLHETTVVEGVSRMRELPGLAIDAGATVRLAPGGKHLMLMEPRQPVDARAPVKLRFVLEDGRRVEADFVVTDQAPADGGGHDQAGHDHHAH
ncbi:MAG TPA: copper chaperone PCu(A)C [Dokdonella sp.]|uniref:copper chaperone PCu(A)C n=1 Tax=Dokdonella sp. TaxID=2291710 RepID=UPI002BECAAA3|nr:copper chaperone PCu(A)C [Dokdonella sp.]HUD42175.1 copper chaperone PCu(A)C [Dokdonella sp.]